MRGRWERPKKASPALFRDSGDGSEATPDMVETTSGLGRRPALWLRAAGLRTALHEATSATPPLTRAIGGEGGV